MGRSVCVGGDEVAKKKRHTRAPLGSKTNVQTSRRSEDPTGCLTANPMVTAEGRLAAVNNPFLLMKLFGSAGFKGARRGTGMAVLLTSIVMVRFLSFSQKTVTVGRDSNDTCICGGISGTSKGVSVVANVSTASSLREVASIGSVGRINSYIREKFKDFESASSYSSHFGPSYWGSGCWMMELWLIRNGGEGKIFGQ